MYEKCNEVNLNTSNVNVNQKILKKRKKTMGDLNTSNVNVNLGFQIFMALPKEFKYI